MVEPLWRSATAESASANNLEPPRSIFGASEGLAVSVEYLDVKEGSREVIGRDDKETAPRNPR